MEKKTTKRKRTVTPKAKAKSKAKAAPTSEKLPRRPAKRKARNQAKRPGGGKRVTPRSPKSQPKRLSAKMAAFVDARLRLDEHGNFTPWAAAYRAAYNVKAGTSETTCERNALYIAQIPAVAAALKAAEQRAVSRIAASAADQKQMLLDKLWGIIRTDLTDIIDYDPKTGMSITAFKDLTPEQRAAIESFEMWETKEGPRVKIKLIGVREKLELGMRYLNLFKSDPAEQQMVQLIIRVEPPAGG